MLSVDEALSEDEALRVVGHLLEHHPTIRSAARNAMGAPVPVTATVATCWCLTGGLSFVAQSFTVPEFDGFWERACAVLGLSPDDDLAFKWDNSPDWRAWAVEKLKRAGL